MFIVVGGATGTGKSEFALALAERSGQRGIGGEIVNADALQLYRGMDIGTAKLPAESRRGVPHHLLDVLDVRDEASVARYQGDARATITDIEARGLDAIVVGGSGFYIESIIHELAFPASDPAVRASLEQELRDRGSGALLHELATVDPVSADKISVNDERRIVRALEVYRTTGQPFRSSLPATPVSWHDYLLVTLTSDKERLAAALRRRAIRMFEHGLIEETRALESIGLREGKTASRAIGYSQALAVLDGKSSVPDAIESTALGTIRYAKRQRTWFRRYKEARAIDPHAATDETLDQILDGAQDR